MTRLIFHNPLPPSRVLRIGTVLCLFTSTLSAGDSVRIAESGKALCPIIVAPSASEQIRGVAEELRDYLQRMTGADFEIQTDTTKPGIRLGTPAEFPLPEFSQQLRIRGQQDGVEAFVIAPRQGSVHLIGATELGASHAAFRFLEQLGCRWFFPAPEWEIIPRRETVVVDFEESDRPAILARRIWWGYGYFDRVERRCQTDYEAWARHNRMAQSFRPYTGHAWQTIIRENQETFDAHPEYLALVKGERRGPQMCISNPAVRTMATAWALNQLEKNQRLDMISMETSDGSGHCECPDCQALGNISDRVFGLANEVARAVAEKYPGKMVGMLAYNDHCEPPSFALEPNVYVQSTAGFVRGRYTFDELMQLWPQKTKNIGFYEYFSVWLWDHDQLPGGRANNLAFLSRQIRKYRQLGATSITCESGNNWGLHGRGYYIANKLMWNPQQNVEQLLNDFYDKAFGPAAAAVRRYHDRFDSGNQPLMSEHLLALGFRDIQEASRLAAGRPDIQKRLDHLKQYLHYVRIRWELDHLPRAESETRKRLTLAGLTWCYRTRYSYMNHWAAMWQSWTSAAAKEFQEPTWSYRHRGDHPWEVDQPVDHEETEQLFLTDLQRFQPEDVEQVDFSQDLVWANLPHPTSPKVRPLPLKHNFQRPMRYVAVSRQSEPLRFRIVTGVIAHYRDRADGRWSVTDAEGNEIASGRLPQDGEPHPLEVPVKTKGYYWIDYQDQGAGWSMESTGETPLSLVLQKGKRIIPLGQLRHPLFFFVPAGTKRVQFFWEGGNLKPHVHAADGTLLAEIQQNGKFVSVPVPPGMDGQAWFFTRFAPKQIWFTNVPNYLAASPASLVLPKEVLQPGR